MKRSDNSCNCGNQVLVKVVQFVFFCSVYCGWLAFLVRYIFRVRKTPPATFRHKIKGFFEYTHLVHGRQKFAA